MQRTNQHLTTGSVSGHDPDDATTWLLRRLAWERRLARLEHADLPRRLGRYRVEPPAPRADVVAAR